MTRQQVLPFLRPAGCDGVWETAPAAGRDRLVRLFAELTVKASAEAVGGADGGGEGRHDQEGADATRRR